MGQRGHPEIADHTTENVTRRSGEPGNVPDQTVPSAGDELGGPSRLYRRQAYRRLGIANLPGIGSVQENR